jgi:protein TonB
MRTPVKWPLAITALATILSYSQQAQPTPQSDPSQPAITWVDAHFGMDKGKLVSCPANFEFRQEDKIYRIGSGIKPPRLTHDAFPDISKEARKAHRDGLINDRTVSLLALVVDASGMPRNVCVTRPAGFGLDEQAAKSVWQYRFDPALKNGEPVAVRIMVEVSFRMH